MNNRFRQFIQLILETHSDTIINRSGLMERIDGTASDVTRMVPNADTIIEFLDSGSEGFAFKLSNGHALKIITGVPDHAMQTFLKVYQDLRDEAFSGSGSIEELMVFDVGVVDLKSEHIDGGFFGNTAYIEMAYLLTLEKWIQQTGEHGIETFLSDISLDAHTQQDVIQGLIKLPREKAIQMLLTLSNRKDAIAHSLVAAYLNILSRGQYDIHPKNVGVIERQGHTPKFVFFDF